MTRAVSLADRLSAVTLRLLAALNLLFFAAFLVAALLAVRQARAEAPACSGHNLVAELAQSDPALLDKVRAEAAKIPNGHGLLWKTEKPGVAPSWLFGTMHVTDPRVIAMTPAADDAFEASRTVVIETTDILDKAKLNAAMLRRLDLTMFTDRTTLQSLLSPDDEKAVEAALSARGVPLASVSKMKPWVLSTLLAIPACENARKAEGVLVLDERLAAKAKAQGKSVGGLETALGQIEAMASLPMSLHVGSLVETAKLGSKMDDIFETMISLYEAGDTGMVWPLIRAVVPETIGQDAEDYAAFEETMILKRNHNMARNAVSFIDRGGAFIAVGAMHLPGREGVIELLRQEGYSVAPAG